MYVPSTDIKDSVPKMFMCVKENGKMVLITISRIEGDNPQLMKKRYKNNFMIQHLILMFLILGFICLRVYSCTYFIVTYLCKNILPKNNETVYCLLALNVTH